MFLVQRKFSRSHDPAPPAGARVGAHLHPALELLHLATTLGYRDNVYLLSATMRWFMSQSGFLARITVVLPNGTTDDQNSFSACRYAG